MNTRTLVRGTIVLALMLFALVVVLLAIHPPSAAQASKSAAPLMTNITVTTSIQAAIDAANPGDTVIIPAGAYTESLTLYKPVSLSGPGSSFATIHAAPGQRVMTVTGGAITNSVIISGVSFTGGDLPANGVCPAGCGGGILISNGAQPKFRNVNIAYNKARSGGGLYVESGGAWLNAVEMMFNTAEDQGGGLSILSGIVTLDSGSIGNNTAQSGGGVYVGSSSAWFNQMTGTIWYNRAISTSVGTSSRGGGLFIEQGRAKLANGQISFNTASGGGGVYVFSPFAQFE